jgi:hypothetical protein
MYRAVNNIGPGGNSSVRVVINTESPNGQLNSPNVSLNLTLPQNPTIEVSWNKSSYSKSQLIAYYKIKFSDYNLF